MADTRRRCWQYSRERDGTVRVRQEITQGEADRLLDPRTNPAAYDVAFLLRENRPQMLNKGAKSGISPRFATFLKRVLLLGGRSIRYVDAHPGKLKALSAQQDGRHATALLGVEHLSIMPVADDIPAGLRWDREAVVNASYCFVVVEDEGAARPQPEKPTARARVSLGELQIQVILLAAWYDANREMAIVIHQVDTAVDVGFGQSRLRIGKDEFELAKTDDEMFDPWTSRSDIPVRVFPRGEKLALKAYIGAVKALGQAFYVRLEDALAATDSKRRGIVANLDWYPHAKGNTVDNPLSTDVVLSWLAAKNVSASPGVESGKTRT